MKTPHKHAELIKAWADGAEIEYQNPDSGEWLLCTPNWKVNLVYRIKPEKKWFRVAEFQYRKTSTGWICMTETSEGEKKFEEFLEFTRWITDRIYYE